MVIIAIPKLDHPDARLLKPLDALAASGLFLSACTELIVASVHARDINRGLLETRRPNAAIRSRLSVVREEAGGAA